MTAADSFANARKLPCFQSDLNFSIYFRYSDRIPIARASAQGNTFKEIDRQPAFTIKHTTLNFKTLITVPR
jgi:hypothetical protein